MGSLTTPGDLAGMVLLAAAILVAASRLLAGRLGSNHPAMHPLPVRHERTSDQQHQGAQPPRPAQPAVVVPWQSNWQSRAGQPAGLVEDRVPGPAALQLEEAIGSRDQ
jgi:hypothetical protein